MSTKNLTQFINVTGTGNCSNIVCENIGSISREMWTGISGDDVSLIPVDTPPDVSDELTIFEIPSNSAEQYGTRMRGYLCPPLSGYYRFWIASDDNSALYLSPDTDPENKVLISSVPVWTNSRQWDKYPSQRSELIYLESGELYYVEALQKEGGGGDNLAVGWQLPNGNFQGPIPGSRLAPFVEQEEEKADLQPNFSFTNPTFNQGNSRHVIVNVNEINGGNTTQKIEFFIPNSSGFTYTFDKELVEADVFGTVLVNNPNWNVTQMNGGMLLNTIIPIGANQVSKVAIMVTADNPSSVGSITVNIVPNEANEGNFMNNSAILTQSVQN